MNFLQKFFTLLIRLSLDRHSQILKDEDVIVLTTADLLYEKSERKKER